MIKAIIHQLLHWKHKIIYENYYWIKYVEIKCECGFKTKYHY